LLYSSLVTLETTFEDIVAPHPDDQRRRAETDTLISLAAEPRAREDGPAGPWHIADGAGIAFSAPHEATHIRDGATKRAERGTASLVFGVARLLGGGAMATMDGQLGDPNWDPDSPYLRRLVRLAGSGPVIDVHIMRPRGVEACLGLGPMPRRGQGLWEPLIAEAVSAGLRVAVNWPYGANPRTVTAQLQRLGLSAVQIELSTECFDPAHPAMVRTWSAVARAARTIRDGLTPR